MINPISTELDSTLAEAVQALRSAMDYLPEGLIIADKKGRFLLCNRAARNLLGMESEPVLDSWPEVKGWFKADGITPYSYQELPATQALAGKALPEAEVFVRSSQCPDGIWLAVQASPLSNNRGEIHGSIVLFHNVTEKRQIDARIRMLTSAVEQTADSIIITDNKATIEYVNPAFESMTGFTSQEALGRTPMILKSGVHDDAFYRDLWLTIISGKVYRNTLVNRKKNGEIFFAEQTITPVRDSPGNITHFVTVIKDVTELRKIQEQEFQMSLARAVQQQFYTTPPPRIPGFDFAGAAFPADATGGDYFDFMLLPQNRLGVVVGDVSGHGISAALLMAELRAYLRAFAQRNSDIGRVLSLTNRALACDLQTNSYATLIFCCLDLSSKSLVYASAGHTPGYVLDSSGAVKYALDSLDIPLGFLPEHKFTRSEPLYLQPGDILALLTDGITEAERPDQTPFGVERALAFIHAHRGETARKIVGGLYQAVRDFSEGLPQSDDITAVICKTEGTGSNGREGLGSTDRDP